MLQSKLGADPPVLARIIADEQQTAWSCSRSLAVGVTNEGFLTLMLGSKSVSPQRGWQSDKRRS